MCGLVGVLGQTLEFNLEVFKELMLLSSFRGIDASGAFTLNHHTTDNNPELFVKYMKANMAPWDFVESKEFNSLVNIHTKFIAGHTRLATKGSLVAANAHPFRAGKIIGMHNGTMRTGCDPLHEKGTDSERLIHILSECDGNIEEALKKVSGAIALVWYDGETKRVNLYRNAERPLAIGTNQFKTQLLYASEPEFIELINKRRKLGLDIRELKTNEHISFPMDYPLVALDKKTEVVINTTFFRPEANGNTERPDPNGSPYGSWEEGIDPKTLPLVETPVDFLKKHGVNYPHSKIPGPKPSTESKSPLIMLPPPSTASSKSGTLPDDSPNDLFTSNQKTVVKSSSRKLNKSSGDGVTKWRLVRDQLEPEYLLEGKHGPRGHAIFGHGNWCLTMEHFRGRLRVGCNWCNTKLGDGEAHKAFWDGQDTYYCDECIDIPDVKNYINGGSA